MGRPVKLKPMEKPEHTVITRTMENPLAPSEIRSMHPLTLVSQEEDDELDLITYVFMNENLERKHYAHRFGGIVVSDPTRMGTLVLPRHLGKNYIWNVEMDPPLSIDERKELNEFMAPKTLEYLETLKTEEDEGDI